MAETILEQTTHTTNVQDVFLLFPPCPNSFRPPLPLSNGQTWKKVPQTILASLYTLPPPLLAMPIWKQHISKRGFL